MLPPVNIEQEVRAVLDNIIIEVTSCTNCSKSNDGADAFAKDDDSPDVIEDGEAQDYFLSLVHLLDLVSECQQFWCLSHLHYSHYFQPLEICHNFSC